MATYMSTAFFQMGAYGWSESYFRDSNSVTDLAALADFDRAGIWTKRVVALARPAVLTAQRTSFVGVRNDSVLNFIPMLGNAAWTAEDPNTAVLCRVGNQDNTRRKNVFMRGVPDDMVINGGQLGGAAGWQTAAQAFFDEIITGNYGWLGIDTRVDIAITGYVKNAQEKIVITLADDPALGLPNSTKVTLQGVNVGVGKPSVLNGPHPYIVTGPAEVTTAKATAVFPFPGLGGFLRKVVKVLIQAKNVRFQKIDTRKAGKVSYLQVGRAKARPKG